MKINENQYKYIYIGILAFLSIILIFVANSLSISYKEALNVLNNSSVLSYITKISMVFFGQNDIAIRLPFILFYILSSVLMYVLTKDYFNKEIDRLTNIVIFMFLPGMLSASLLINSAIVVTFCTLLYLYYYQKYEKHNYYLLGIFLFVDNSFAIFFLGLFFYALSRKENRLLLVSLLLFGLSMYIYGFSSEGKPRSYFIDTFMIYATVFSPLLFIYYLYSMYRMGIKNKRTLFWYISVTALIFSFLFSFRQKIYIEDFAPYVVITLPIMLKLFFHTLRVRLPEFRKLHHALMKITIFLLVVNSLLTLYNKPLYLLLSNPEKHFVYDYHFAKDIAEILKTNNINNIKVFDKRLEKRLEFYGIKRGDKYVVSLKNPSNYDYKFTIEYIKKDLIDIYVYKVKK